MAEQRATDTTTTSLSSGLSSEQVWRGALGLLQEEIPAPSFSSIISPLWLVSLNEETCTVGVINSFLKDIVEARYLELISKAISRTLGKESIKTVLTISSPPQVVEEVAVREPLKEEKHEIFPPRLNQPVPHKKYTFENFVVGDSNKFAYSAALMVAEFPGQTYNPLFIYGGTGLGKTHLLYAIQDYAQTMTPNIRVKYIQTSRFIDDFIATLTFKRDKEAFDRKYIDNKIVLFDDVQTLSGTDATQAKFFDIFNLLHASESHIVLSSDRPPAEIPQLSDRIRSRFEGGLMIDIKPPDLETRLAILRKKADCEGVDIPDDALIYIASKVQDNIRTLEGFFHRVTAYAGLYSTKIDLEMVQAVLKDQVNESPGSKSPSVEAIQNIVSGYYGISPAELTGKNRSRNLVQARQISMYLCRELTDETLMSIGLYFGGRDHSTVLHSCKKVESMIKQKTDIYRQVSELTNMINKSL